MYSAIRSALFKLSAENAHHFTLNALNYLGFLPGFNSLLERMFSIKNKKLHRVFWGIHFPNPVGLAAGLDKNGEVFPEMSNLGFGFVEIGTVTPKGQEGNPSPRLFRIIEDEAIINRMGFNNVGVEEMIHNIKKGRKRRGGNVVLGGNIGKNKITPNEDANQDYLTCLEALYPYVDYFVVNVSSPNTPNLRALQDKEPLTELLQQLKVAMANKPRAKPILLKIAPDLNNEQLDDIIEILNSPIIDGIVATNTTISREGLSLSQEEIEKMGAGGLSGHPLTQRSTEIVRYISKHTHKPIIAVGGIMTVQDALEKFRAGASLVQLYSGFIFKGPNLIKEINQALINKCSAPNCK
ncbi:MAG: quinone-dependent dihydroorotate dehydrogenase [Chitinophagales bacterium]|nr:quinone-dependent dihydroorotate dehydrogenase [Chitinophagales bacterium]MCZ2393173.1 quinone-dependent dihydroorotate dehydrogenase [Chitinophagales bacterium]